MLDIKPKRKSALLCLILRLIHDLRTKKRFFFFPKKKNCWNSVVATRAISTVFFFSGEDVILCEMGKSKTNVVWAFLVMPWG